MAPQLLCTQDIADASSLCPSWSRQLLTISAAVFQTEPDTGFTAFAGFRTRRYVMLRGVKAADAPRSMEELRSALDLTLLDLLARLGVAGPRQAVLTEYRLYRLCGDLLLSMRAKPPKPEPAGIRRVGKVGNRAGAGFA